MMPQGSCLYKIYVVSQAQKAELMKVASTIIDKTWPDLGITQIYGNERVSRNNDSVVVQWSCLYKIYDGGPAQKAELKKVASFVIDKTLIFPIFNGK